MNCLFDEKKKCPLGGKIILENMGRFCQSCIGRDALARTMEISKGMKATLIISLLRLFPEEDKAKGEYQELMKKVEEW